MNAIETLRAMGACDDAIAWAKSHGGGPDALWRDCPRGDWLLWYAGRAGTPREALVRAAAACAELALPHAGDLRPVCEAAIAAARAWAANPTPEMARAAADAADAARAAAYAARAAYAALAAAYTAYVAADAAAYAAYVAADAAAYAADAVAAMRQACADAVRREIGARP